MTISVSALALLVMLALLGSALAPVILIYFLFKDWQNQRLW